MREELRPGAIVECAACSGNGRFDICMRGFGVAQQPFFGMRRDHIDLAIARACAPLSIDEQAQRAARGDPAQRLG
nr:hypothetical protein [Xanthomonas vasicola]MDO6985410.1 hypothetical protein [Xanthomonas vasicola]